MKDNFSSQSDNYARYRPGYPKILFEYLLSMVSDKEKAWDCGTGNGQVASVLADSFGTVFATDISQSQLNQAIQKPNIQYSVQDSAQTDFPDRQFDLIIVAQAIHWFDFEKFYNEARRTAKHNALLCVLGYGKLVISKEADEIISDFYTRIIGPYWDKERKYIDEAYTTIPFPFEEIQTPAFSMEYHWTLEHLTGYFNTWSAVKHYIKKENTNPVNELYTRLKPLWQEGETKRVLFPLFIRLGKLN